MKTEDRDKFAQEVVALARKYNVGSVALQYRDGFARMGANDDTRTSGEHTIAWASGRHGANGVITLSYRDTRQCSEFLATPKGMSDGE